MQGEGANSPDAAEEHKIRLLSRVFCMFSLDDTEIGAGKVMDGAMPLPFIDFDIA